MKHKLRVAMLILLVPGLKISIRAQEPSQLGSHAPAVIVAVAPNYFPTALHSHASGEIVIEIKVDSEGLVSSTEAVSGNPVLAAGSRQVARRWRFAPATDKGIRTARLTFVYRLVPKGTPTNELLPVFKPPYRVEIVQVLPDQKPWSQSRQKGRRSNSRTN